MITLRESAGGVIFEVKVHPRARKNAITGVLGDALKLALTAPPVEGKANQGVIDFFAGFFAVPRSAVSIVSGLTSRNKIVRVNGLNSQAVERHLSRALNVEPY